MKTIPIFLVGGGGHCSSVVDVLELAGIYEILGIVDVAERLGAHVLKHPIMATDDEIPSLVERCPNFLITIGHLGDASRRIEMYRCLMRAGASFPVIISPLAYVSKHASVGPGTVVHHHAVINANARVGSNCIINTKALIEHDAVVGDHCHISTASVLNGSVVVGAGTFFGSGAVSRQSTTIPPNSFVKANSIYKG